MFRQLTNHQPEAWGTTDVPSSKTNANNALETKNLEGSTVLTKAPDAGAFTNDIVTEALALLDAKGVDTKGAGYAPITVTINPGGA